jgi:DNA-binding CsgD family transcriptional regulator
VAGVGGLVEREAELVVIDECIRSAIAGQGGVVIVVGQAGIGKTALLEEASRRAAGGGMVVVSGQGAVLEEDFGFGVVRQLFEPVIGGASPRARRRLLAGAAALARPVVQPDRAGGEAPAQQTAMMHGLYWLTANLAERAPMMVAVDDAHWSDVPSLRFLTYLARRLEGLPVLVVVAVRMGDPPVDATVIGELLSAPEARVIRPAALSVDGVGQLVRARLGDAADESFIEACRGATGGVPFLVGELVGLLSVDRVPPTGEAAEQVARAGPRTVAHATMLRLSRLSPSAGAVARAVAVLGRHARLDRVAALEGLDAPYIQEAVDALIGMEILAPGPPVRFAHPLVHQAIYDDLPPTARAAAHGRAGRILAGERAPADEVAAHLLLTEPMGRLDVVEVLRAAASQTLARGAPASAVAYLRRALAEGAAEGDRAGLLLELGRAEALVQDPHAAANLEEAWDLTDDPVARARLRMELSEIYLLSGQWDRHLQDMRSALAELGDRDPDLAARIEARRAAFEFYDPRFASGFETQLPRLLTLVEKGGPGPRALALVLGALGALRGMERAEALALVERGLEGGHLVRDEGSESLVIPQAIGALTALDEPERAGRAAEGVFEDARRRGSIMGYIMGCLYRLAIDALRGALKRAEADMRSAIELCVTHGIPFALPTAFTWGADIVLERPQLDDLAAVLESVQLEPALAATTAGAFLLAPRGRLRSIRGDREAAVRDLRAAGEIFTGLQFRNPILALWRSPLALALPPEDAAEARSLVEEELRDATTCGLARCRGVALRAAGCLEGGGRGIELLEESLIVLQDTEAPLESARTLVELGAAMRRANRRVIAREPLLAGLDLAQRCGADRLAARAVEELRATGARPRRRAVSGPDALTSSEGRVARMAADGMSNREIAQSLFVTAKTVENQLGAVYRKLGVRSRDQLREVLAAPGSSA